MRLLLSGLIVFFFTASASAQQVLEGFQEVVLVTKDRQAWVSTMEEAGGWETLGEGDVSQSWMALWGVEGNAQYTLIGNPGTKRGFIRLIEFDTPADLIRPNDQTWDTGGLFDINLRVADMEAARSSLMKQGWSASSDPVSFTFGPFVVSEWIPRGPDSVRFAIIERIQPTLEGWPHLKKLSRVFNSTMVIENMAEGRRFWEGLLGFKTYLEHKGASKEEGPNVLGLPHNITTQVPREVVILHPDAKNEGSIELLTFEGATGRSFEARSGMPNRGLSRLRFPVSGLDALAKKASSMGYQVEARGQGLPLSGVGSVNVAVLVAPGGARIELYEAAGD